MDNTEKLKYGRNILLKLHKSLVDFERGRHEALNGPMNSGEFLNVLLEDPDFAWLRKFSTLIVEIDEMFDLNDGYSEEMVTANLEKLRELVDMTEPDEYFRSRYKYGLQNNPEAAGSHGQLKALLSEHADQ